MAEEDLTPEQQAALTALGAARGPCPPAEALVEYDALAVNARAAHPIHAHVQVCSRCQLVLLNLEDAAPVSTRSPLRWALPLAAAIAIGVAGTFVYRSGSPEGAADTVRGTDLQPMAPAGAVQAVTFRWQSPIRAARYRVTVFQGSRVAWTGETAGLTLTPPDVSLEPGEYEWQVDAIDAEGAVRLSSPRTRFSLTR